VDRLRTLREQTGWNIDLLLMDDNSKDGSEELVRAINLPWIRMVVRTDDRGLSQAVLDGLHRSSGDILVVMAADLSHPTERIPELVQALENGSDFAVSSRFAEGGSTDDDWGLFRWLNSQVATMLALPLTRLTEFILPACHGVLAERPGGTASAGQPKLPLKLGSALMDQLCTSAS